MKLESQWLQIPHLEKRFVSHKGGDWWEMKDWYRHGDVIIKAISQKAYKEMMEAHPAKNDYVVAYGEATGHHHALQAKTGTAQVLVSADNQQTVAFSVKQDTKLTHEEHKTIELPKGYYQVEFEREYNPLEQVSQQVYDWKNVPPKSVIYVKA